MSPRKPPLTVSILGAGRVGQTLGRRAQESGLTIVDVVCRSPRSARSAAQFIGAGKAQATSKARLAAAELFLISTPDDQIGDAARLLQQSGIQNAVALHTSGALSGAVLKPLKEQGFATGSCHPLQSFAAPVANAEMLGKTYFCIEGEARARRLARRLVEAIGAQHFEIESKNKSLYHAAAVLSSGGVTTLLSVSLGLLEQCGLPESQARQVLLPLVEGTLANIRAAGAARALTGPVRRGDAGTVETNLRALAAADSRALELYRLLAKLSLELAAEAGTDAAALRRIAKRLKTI